MAKIVIVGAGGVIFTQNFLKDILLDDGISPVTPMPEVRRAKFLVVFFCL